MKIPSTIIALDFETYYSKDYTLRKKDTSTTEYIRDPRFKTHGISIRRNDESKATWYQGDDVARVLDDIDWSNVAMLAHHAHFDGLILSHHYGHVPAFYLDTLSMARPLHGGAIDNDLDTVSKHYGGRGKKGNVINKIMGIRDLPPDLMKELAMYGCQDTDEMCRIYGCMLPHYTHEELLLIHYTIKAYADPLLQVDKELARKVHLQELENKRKLLVKVGIGTYKELQDEKTYLKLKKKVTSRPQFAQRLISLGVEPPMKKSPTTGKPTFAFAKNDIAFQKLEVHPNEDVRDLVEARLICQSSIEETRSQRLISHADPALPIYLAYGKAHTFRWAGGDKMNPQNFGRESDLRNAILAPPGYKLVIVDSAQIEARVNAWLADEIKLVEGFRNNEDIYSKFSSDDIYFIPIEEIDKIKRFVGKTCILGLGYQMGWSKFKYTLEAGVMGPKAYLGEDIKYKETVARYRARFPRIRDQWYYFQDRLYDMWKGKEVTYGPIRFVKDGIELPNRMKLRYPNLKGHWDEGRGFYTDFTYNEKTKIYGGLLVENVVQALARIVVAEQALKIADFYRIVLLVHDEVVLCVPDNQAEEALERTLTAFKTPLPWCKSLPVDGEGQVSQCYLKM